MMHIYRSVAFLFLLLVSRYGAAQDSFTRVEGILSNTVYDCYQDSLGYIWIATEGGLTQYDGLKFKHFTSDDGLSDHEVFHVFEEKNRRFWSLTNNGFPSVIEDGKVRSIDDTGLLKAISPGGVSMDMLRVEDNTLWYINNNVAVRMQNGVEAVIRAKEMNGRKQIFFGAISWNKMVWILTAEGLLREDEQEFLPFPVGVISNPLRAKYVLMGNKLYISDEVSLFSYDLSSHIFSREVSVNDLIINLSVDPLNKIVIIPSRRAIYSWNPGTKLLDTLKVPDKVSWFTSWLKDREGNIWVSSLTGGLFFAENPTLIRLRHVPFKSANGGTTVYSLSVIDSKIYAGYDNGEYLVIDHGNLAVYQSSLTVGRSRVLQFYDADSVVWVAAGNRFLKQSKKGRILKELPLDVKGIEMVANGVYLALSQGLLFLDYKIMATLKERSLPILLKKNMLEKRVNVILKQGDDTLWIGGVQGLKVYIRNKPVTLSFAGAEIISVPISKIRKSPCGIVAFTTLGRGVGVIWQNQLVSITKSHGLSSNICHDLFFVNDMSLLIANDKGIDEISYANGKLKVRTLNGELGTWQLRASAVVKYNDTLWIGSEKGLFFHSYKGQKKTIPPVVHIEALNTDDSTYLFPDYVVLPYHQNRLVVRYTGIAYYAKGLISYRYRLKGAQEEWQTTTQNFVSFSFLAPGRYEFQITAAGASGLYNPVVKKLYVTILTPFYNKWWFYLTIVFICGTAVWTITRYILNNVKKKHLLQQQELEIQRQKALAQAERLEYESQLATLEHKALQLQMNPHFIFNAVAAIQGFYAMGNQVKAKGYTAIFSRLLRNIFEVASQSIIPVSQEIQLLKDYIELTIQRTEYQIDYVIETNIRGQEEYFGITPMLIQPFVENALIHGLLPARRNGKLIIQIIRMTEDSFHCIIEDNGIGRTFRNNNKERNETGMSLTFKRIQLLNETKQDTHYAIHDLKDEHGRSTGTRIEFRTNCINLY